MIEAVIFDWGGVIQRTVDRAPRRALAAELGLHEDALEASVFESEPWRGASTGQVPADRAWVSIVAALGWPPERVEEFITRFFAGDRLDERIVSLIRDLRESGVLVGLLSNALPPYGAARWGMPGLFDAQVFSYLVGDLKPKPAMYKAALRALGVEQPCRALFVDDAPENVAAARALELRAHQFTGLEALQDELARWELLQDRLGPRKRPADSGEAKES